MPRSTARFAAKMPSVKARCFSSAMRMSSAVAVAGAARQHRYGNVNLRDALMVGALSPLGVAVGVVVANAVPERILELGFAALALFMAFQLLRRARADAASGAAPPPP